MIKVIIERRCLPGKEAELEGLLLELRTRAMRQPGYVSGETLKGDTLRTVDDPSLWLVISAWVDADSWLAWESKPERREIASKIEPLLVAPEEVTVFRIPSWAREESSNTIDE